jgi:hypothetical protein
MRVRCTYRIGWHNDVHVLPDRTIGAGEEMVMFQAAAGVVSQFKQRGTLMGWRDEVASLCKGQFASPVLCVGRVCRAAVIPGALAIRRLPHLERQLQWQEHSVQGGRFGLRREGLPAKLAYDG